MAEPKILKRGKDFQKRVQADFAVNSRDGTSRSEVPISYAYLHRRRENAGRPGKSRAGGGRADILITELGDFVTILEIKATDWDRIIPRNVTKNLWSHQRQLFRYVDKYLEVDGLDVCLGIIYPRPPTKAGLRERVESYLESYGVPAYWYNEIQS